MRCSRKFYPVIFGLSVSLGSAWAAEADGGTRRLFAQVAPDEAGGGRNEPEAKPARKSKEKDAVTDKDEGRGGTDEAEKKKGGKPGLQLMLPLPIGLDSHGVVVPVADPETGKKAFVFDIGVARRLDDENVKMTNLIIETFEAKTEDKEMTIELPDSMLNMKTGVITGKKRVAIKRSDFDITGTTMEFDTNTRQGKIRGDVKMTIYDLNLKAPSPSPASPKAGE